MNPTSIRWAGLALLSGSLLTMIGCSTPSGTEEVTAVETAEGAIVVDTFRTSATVAGIDPAKRKVSLVLSDGRKATFKAGPEIVNFDQIRVGDEVRATVTEEVAVYLGAGAPPSAEAAAGVALAPVGAKPAGVLVDTFQVTATVMTVDASKRRVSLALPDGTVKKVKAGKKVDLSTVRPGDTVTLRVSEGLAISVNPR